MLRVGLTGGIATGKSAVATELRRLGLPVIDADKLARRVVAPGRPAFDEIVRRFGTGIISPDGGLDRAALGRVVFSDDAARADLEAITHPEIALEAAAWLQEQTAAGAMVAIYEAPLIFEAGLESRLDVIIVVAAQPETQLRRLRLRDGLSQEEARRRLAAQMPTEEKVRRAHHVIWNDGTLEELRAQVAGVHRALLDTAKATTPQHE